MYQRDWEEDADVEAIATAGCSNFPCNQRLMSVNDLCQQCRSEFEEWLTWIELDFEEGKVPPYAPIELEVDPLGVIELEEAQRQRKQPANQPPPPPAEEERNAA